MMCFHKKRCELSNYVVKFSGTILNRTGLLLRRKTCRNEQNKVFEEGLILNFAMKHFVRFEKHLEECDRVKSHIVV